MDCKQCKYVFDDANQCNTIYDKYGVELIIILCKTLLGSCFVVLKCVEVDGVLESGIPLFILLNTFDK